MKKNFIDKSRRNDRIAELLIRFGGVAVIVAVVWILVMISKVALPLFYPASAKVAATLPLPAAIPIGKVLAIGSDEGQQGVFILDDSGAFHFLKSADGSLSASIKTPVVPKGAVRVVSAEATGKSVYNLLWDNGAISAVSVVLASAKDGDGKISLTHDVTSLDGLSFGPAGGVLQSFARMIEGKGALRVDRLSGERLRVTHQLVEKDLLDNEKRSTSTDEISDPLPGHLSDLALDSKGHYLYAGTDNGWLLRWDVSEPGQIRLLESVPASVGKQAITSLTLLLGDVSVAVADAQGNLSTWFPVKVSGSGEDRQLTRIHTLRSMVGKITTILPSPRDKSLFSIGSAEIHVDHMTSERNLLTIKSTAAVTYAALSPKGNTLAALDNKGVLTLWKLDIPHPEISFGTLFGKVWYEGYDKPEYAWQSSAANDDFEPKLSLVPLVFGTIKATLFAMLFAVPLALLAALYTSQFMSPKLKGRVKPVVEIMAAIPSVVIGFPGRTLAGAADR